MNDPSVTVVGNVAKAPELRTTSGGIAVTDFRVAATPRRLDKATDTWSDGETMWFTVSAWRALAEHCCASIKKGDRVVVTGKLSLKGWTTAEGVERTGMEIEALTVGMDLSRGNATYVKTSRPVAEPGVDRETGVVEPGGPYDLDEPEDADLRDDLVEESEAEVVRLVA